MKKIIVISMLSVLFLNGFCQSDSIYINQEYLSEFNIELPNDYDTIYTYGKCIYIIIDSTKKATFKDFLPILSIWGPIFILGEIGLKYANPALFLIAGTSFIISLPIVYFITKKRVFDKQFIRIKIPKNQRTI